MENINILTFLTPKVLTAYLSCNATLRQALEKIDYHKFSVIPLIDEKGDFVSTISEGDILRYIKNKGSFSIEEASRISIDEIERYRPYKALDISTDFETILNLSLNQNFIPIVDDRGVYIGIIKRKDIIESLMKSNKVN